MTDWSVIYMQLDRQLQWSFKYLLLKDKRDVPTI
jgi:hypothetical protein